MASSARRLQSNDSFGNSYASRNTPRNCADRWWCRVADRCAVANPDPAPTCECGEPWCVAAVVASTRSKNEGSTLARMDSSGTKPCAMR